MAQTAQIQVRIDPQIKEEATKVFNSLGLSLSSAIKMFCTQASRTKRLPINPNETITENGYTVAQEEEMLSEVEYALKYGKRYTNIKEAHTDILKDI